MDTNKYSVPSAETGVTTLLGKVFKDGLNQSELAAAYDDVSKDYDKVLSRVYTVREFFCLPMFIILKTCMQYLLRRRIFAPKALIFINFSHVISSINL